jgi:putative Holliday junction resolvase
MSKRPIQRPNYLGVDFGGKRIGVARAGSIAKLAEPLVTIPADGTEVARIMELAAKEDAGTIVVGLPRGLDGQHTEQTGLAEKFASVLKESGLKVVMVDEALTSHAAEGFLKTKHRPGWVHEDVDNIAAMILLDDYLSQF